MRKKNKYSYKRQTRTEILITPTVTQKETALVRACEVEIGWFGIVEKVTVNGVQKFCVTDILVPEQNVTGASIDTGGPDLGAFLMEHMEVAEKLQYYGHSHVNFDCKPSITDLDQIVDWEEYGMDFLINHIQNKAGETHTQLDQFKPRRITTNVKRIVIPSKEAVEWAQKQILDQLEIYKSVKRPNSTSYDYTVIKEKGKEPTESSW